MAGKKNILAIWKINREMRALCDLDSEMVIDKIIAEFDNSKNGDFHFMAVPVVEKFKNKKVRLYSKQRFSDTWKEFVNPILNSDLINQNNKYEDIFKSIAKDHILFVFDDKDIFVLTSGASYFAIQKFIDDSFPLSIAKKIFKGNFNHAEIRDLVGEVYSKTENYRRSYSFSRSEAFGKIWKKLYGEVDPDIIKKNPDLELIFGKNKPVNAEMKSSFTFRKSVTLEQIIVLINAIQTLPVLSDARKRKFKYLDTFKEVTKKEIKEKLNDEIVKKIFKAVQSNNFSEIEGFDFCHPEEVVDFLSGKNFIIKNDNMRIDHAPKAFEILKFIKSNNVIDASLNIDDFKKEFKKTKFSFQAFDDSVTKKADLLKYFHGEIKYINKTYFYVDGKWYEPIGDFFKNLLDDVIDVLFEDDGILRNKVPFSNWVENDEGEFNDKYKQESNFYYGDKCFLKDGRGTVELFDLLYVDRDTIYIVQVKDGFGASVRDAVSQIEFASDIIEEDARGSFEKLKEYYKDWNVNEKKKITEKEFVELFNKKRVYVMAVGHKTKMNKANFKNKKFQSKIAQFETIALAHSFKRKNREIIIQHIKKVK